MKKRPSTSSPAAKPLEAPKLAKHLVVFLDMLGFRAQMVQAATDGTGDKLLAEYHRVVGGALRIIRDGDPKRAERTYRGFTDNFVLASRVYDPKETEAELGELLVRVSEFQLVLAASGWFVRGAIVFGDHFMDDALVFGTPIVEAYGLESNVARDPRIVLSDEVAKMASQHLKYYANEFQSPHNGYLLRDTDGRLFVNYLYTPIGGDAGKKTTLAWVKRHKVQVEARLKECASQPNVWAKYRWVAEYHNFFCRKWSLPSGSRIAAAALRSEPELLVAHPPKGAPVDMD